MRINSCWKQDMCYNDFGDCKLLLTQFLWWSCRWGAWPVRWPVRGGRARQVDGVQLEGQPPRRAERPASSQTGVRLLHQIVGPGLRWDRSDALLLPPQHHQGTLRALPAGDGSGNTWIIQGFSDGWRGSVIITAAQTSVDTVLIIYSSVIVAEGGASLGVSTHCVSCLWWSFSASLAALLSWVCQESCWGRFSSVTLFNGLK